MIYTVTGPVSKDELGMTLSHEHIKWGSPFAQHMYFTGAYDDEEVDELFKTLLPVFNSLYAAGCRVVAEASPPFGGQNLRLMYRLSRTSGVRIIANTGRALPAYTYHIHSTNYYQELAERWIRDFEEGLETIETTVVRPSHIKIFTGDETLHPFQKQGIRAALIASKATGLPIHCHIWKAQLAEEVMDLLEQEETDYTRFCWSHASQDPDNAVLARAAATGMWLGFDLITPDRYQSHCELIKNAIVGNYENRILLSQDVDFHEQASQDKVANCSALFTGFIPYCEEQGIDSQVLRRVLRENPANYFYVEDEGPRRTPDTERHLW